MPAWLLPAIMGLGSIFGGAAKGAGQSRENFNQQQFLGDRNVLDRYQAQQQAILQALGLQERGAMDRAQLDLQQRNFALGAPSVRGKQALLGSLMQNMQPVKFSGLSPQIASRMPQISGGMSPAAIGPLARQMGLVLQQNALQGQQAGDQFAPVPQTNFTGGLIPPPELSKPKAPGALEKILGGVGLGGSLLGGLGSILNQRKTTPPYIPMGAG